MRRGLAYRDLIVVTVDALLWAVTAVIHRSGYPRAGAMAGVTHIGADNMVWPFTGLGKSPGHMAAHATARLHLRVIHLHRL